MLSATKQIAACIAIACTVASAATAATAPTIAIWNPVTSSEGPHHSILATRNEAAASSLRESGAEVTMLTAAQIVSGELIKMDAPQFDAVFFIGEGFPGAAMRSLQEFSDKGGILVSIGAKVPFLIRVEQDAQGEWQPTPLES